MVAIKRLNVTLYLYCLYIISSFVTHTAAKHPLAWLVPGRANTWQQSLLPASRWVW